MKNTQNIISNELQAVSQHLYVTASIFINNRPDTSGMSETEKILTINKYIYHFFRTNDSIQAVLAHISEISLVDPLKSATDFIDTLPKIEISPDFSPPATISFISWFDKTTIANEDVQYYLKIMSEIIAAKFMQLLLSRLFDQNEVDKKPEGDSQISIDSHKLYSLIILHAFSVTNEKDLTRISLITSRYWAQSLFYVCPYVDTDAFDAMTSAMQKIENAPHVLHCVYMNFFSGFHPSSLTLDQLNKFTNYVKPVAKSMMKNFDDIQYCSIFCIFFFNFFGEAMTHCPGADINNLTKPLAKFISNCLSHPEKCIPAPEIEALRLVFSGEKERHVTSFIEKKLIPLLQYPNRSVDFLKSLTILLRGRNYENQILLDKFHNNFGWKNSDSVNLNVVYSAFERAVGKGSYFSTAQNELSMFLVQLASIDLKSFQKEKFSLISSTVFTTNNNLAYTAAITSMLLPGSPFYADKYLMPIVSKSADTVLRNFLKESLISLAPTNSTIFYVQSLVSALKTTSLHLNPFLQQLPKISHPIQPDNVSPKIMQVKWERAGSRMIPNSISKHYQPELKLTSGFADRKETNRMLGPIGVLNMTIFTTLNQNIIKTLSSFILSSTDHIAAMTMHVLQASIHKQNSLCSTILSCVAQTVFLCPTIEHAHLFRIVYTIEQIVDSAVYLKIQPTKEIIVPIVQVSVLGLCSSSPFIRSEALKLLALAVPIIGVGVFAAFEANETLSSKQPSITAQKSFMLDFLSTDMYTFTDIAASSLNTLYQFFLASYAHYLSVYDKEVIQYLLKCLNLFEKRSCDCFFLQNIYVFVINCIKKSNVSYFSPEDIWIDLISMYNECQDESFSPSLFSAIDECVVNDFLRPDVSFLQPASFELSQLVKSSAIDTSILMPIVNKMLSFVFEQGPNSLSIDDSSEPTNNEGDPSTYYQLMSAQFIFSRIYNEMKECSHSPFPVQKSVLPITSEKMQSVFNCEDWYDILLSLINTGSSVISSMAIECFKEALLVFPPSEAKINLMLQNKKIIRSKLLPPLFTWAFEGNATKFLANACEDDYYFSAFAGQFSYLGQPNDFINAWKFAVDGSQNNYFSKFIYTHAGDLIALSFYYLLSSNEQGLKSKALDVLSSVSLTIILWKHGAERCSKMFKMMYSIKRYLSRSLSVVLSTELQKVSELLSEDISFIGEQFIHRMLRLSSTKRITPFITTFVNLIIPWISSHVDLSITNSKENCVCPSTDKVFRCMVPCTLFSCISDLSQSTVLNKAVNAIIKKGELPHHMITLFAAHLFADNNTPPSAKEKSFSVAAFLLGTLPDETIEIYSRLVSVDFFKGIQDKAYFGRLVQFVYKVFLNFPSHSKKNIHVSKEKFAKLFAAMDAHSFDSSVISVEFHMYFDIEEYTKSLMQWTHCDDVRISSNAMLTLGKHEECMSNINPDLAMKDCLRSAYELATLDKNELLKTQEEKNEYIAPRLATIEASLTMVSKCPSTGSMKYFWTAVSFLKYTTNESEKITYSSLLLINRVLQQNDESEIQQIISQKPDSFEGIVNLMIDGIFTVSTKELWLKAIQHIPKELLIDDENSPVFEILNANEFPINIHDKKQKESVNDTIKKMSVEDRQRIINFLPSFAITTEGNDNERIPLLHFISEVINSCLDCGDKVDFSPLTNLGSVIKTEIVKTLTDAHISLIRAISRAKIAVKTVRIVSKKEKSEEKFPFVLVNGEGGTKADSENYIPAAKSIDLVDESLLNEWKQATSVPSISSIIAKEEDIDVDIPQIRVSDIEEFSHIVMA